MRAIVAFGAASAAAALAAKYTLNIDVTTMTSPQVPVNVTWSGITEASKGDWLAVSCDQPTGGYYWWQYAPGTSSGSAAMTLWANGLESGCNKIFIAYYTGSNSVIGASPMVTLQPMIQQVHLSVVNGRTDAMLVEFVSSAGGSSASCAYGTSPTRLNATATGSSFHFATVGQMANVLLTGLQPATTYYYACTDGVVTSDTFHFTNQQNARAPIFAVFADFGVDDGFGLAQISADALSGAYDYVVHAGDFAYDFDSDNGANGNFFMNRGMTYSAFYPLQPAPGNHEAGSNFSHYKNRFAGVAAHSNSGSALYYSFDVQGVHFLAFNSETYIDGGIEEMLNFMTADLAAVDKRATPWVVAYSHKLFWMDNTDFSSISGVLQSGGVDVLFAGHWHYYERYVPYDPVSRAAGACGDDNHTCTDPQYIIMIVSGAPGDVERNDACPGDPSLAPVVPTCSSGYGYGTFQPMNATHLYWQFTAVETPIGASDVDVRVGSVAPVTYTDYVWVVRSAPPA